MASVVSVGSEPQPAPAAAAPEPAPAPRAPLPETGRRRTPTILQLEAVECGAAALAMVLAYYGRHVPLEQMRVDCGVSRDGSKANGLLRAARTHGMVARGFKKEPDDLASLPLPAIVFWNFNHFVVLEGFHQGRAWLNDPARGRRSVDAAEFDQAFTGVVLTFEPGPGFERGGHPPSVLRSLRQYLTGFHTAVALAFTLGLVLVIPGIVMPWLLGKFVDDVLVAKLDGVAMPLLTGLAVAALARAVLMWLQARLLMGTFGRAARASARGFVAHALALPMSFYSQRSPGEIAARVDLNERVAETISSDLAHIALNFLTASFFLVLMARMDGWLTVIVIACFEAELLAWRALARRTAEVSQELSVQGGKLAGVATGGLANIESIKAGGQEAALFLKWIGLQVQYVNASIRAQRYLVTLGQAPALLGLAAQLAVLGVGAWLIMKGDFTVGDLVAFQVLLAGFTAPAHALFTHMQKLQTLRGDLSRLDDVRRHAAEAGVEVQARQAPVPAARIAGALELRDVTFGYGRNDPPLVSLFSLSVKPGGRVAIVGASGSGKSTIARLAAGLFKPWSGEILFDGVARSAYERAHLAEAVAYVDQDVMLFEGSVRDNLTLWGEASDAALHAALADAAIEADVLLREGGLDAPLQEAARNLSGGQRQRLEIARALVRNPRVLILDEATSALDPATEAIVEANLRKRNVTCLVVAHRLSTVRDADEILVLDAGQVVERGTYEALKAMRGKFAQLVASESDDG
ncbi:MAG TPA: NHLP family bacteriocin export ABC transporter peptidase/permease/ATPase subunit [Usitatibacter sp.]|nr:NHLP family bacteriocin export ABC transporter peptidase/permease/ATPase subunit [Usitatibacter sp.]